MELRAPAIAVVSLAVLTAFWSVQTDDTQDEEFCALYGRVLGPEDHSISHGNLMLLDHSNSPRDPCNGDDLWHYADSDLVGIDGVLFDDCVVSWTAGGRTAASELGLVCE